jgi:hypothetical protein
MNCCPVRTLTTCGHASALHAHISLAVRSSSNPFHHMASLPITSLWRVCGFRRSYFNHSPRCAHSEILRPICAEELQGAWMPLTNRYCPACRRDLTTVAKNLSAYTLRQRQVQLKHQEFEVNPPASEVTQGTHLLFGYLSLLLLKARFVYNTGLGSDSFKLLLSRLISHCCHGCPFSFETCTCHW